MATITRIEDAFSNLSHVRRGPKTDAVKNHRIIFRLNDAQYEALVRLSNRLNPEDPNPNMTARAIVCDILDRYAN